MCQKVCECVFVRAGGCVFSRICELADEEILQDHHSTVVSGQYNPLGGVVHEEEENSGILHSIPHKDLS